MGSPPVAGAPSGHASKSDIAPVSKADRTPGAKSAKKAPWRSPGVALSRRDENAPGGFVAPNSAPKSARARKLDARSPATAGSSKTRGGKPRLESDVSTEATADESADGDDAVTSAVDAVNTILLTPPSARGKPDADVTAAIDTVAMPPPPPRVPAASDAEGPVAHLSGSLFSEREPEAPSPDDAADDVDLGAATTAIPSARAVMAATDAADQTEPFESDDRNETTEVGEDGIAESHANPKTPAAPSLGSPFSAPATSPRIPPGATPGFDARDPLDRTMDELTPLRAVEDVTETAAFGVTGALPRLATPTMDLTPLGARAGAEPSPAPSPAPRPGAVQIGGVPANGIARGFPARRGFDATLFDAKDFEPTEVMPRGGLNGVNGPGGGGGVGAYAPFEEKDFEPTEAVPSAAAREAAFAAAKTPGSAVRSARVPPRPPTPKTGGAAGAGTGTGTPQWARNSKAWHEQQQAQMEAMLAQAKRELEAARDAREKPEASASDAEARQAVLTAMLEEQKQQIEAQRREMREAAENAAEERERMKAELRAQMEAQERTRRRVSEIASRAANGAGGSFSSLAGLTSSMDLAEMAQDAALANGLTPANLAPVEAQLRACREAISARAAESERLTARQRQLQREEADLHFRVAELQRYALRLALDPTAALPADLPPMPPPLAPEPIAAATGSFGNAQTAQNAALEYYGAVAARREASGSMDEDGFYVVDASTGIGAGSGGSASFASGVATAGSARDRDLPATATATRAPHAAAPPVAAAAPPFGGYGVPAEHGATRALAAEPGAGAAAPDFSAAAALASRRAPSQVLELRKEVLDVRFVGYGGESGAADDATPPSALMTTTADGCLRLYAAGARRPAAMLRGPREGVAAVAAVGVEAFVAAAGAGGYVARYDLASGRELGALLAVPADDSGAEYSGLGYAAAGAKRLACVAAGGPGSGLVAAAGEGGDVHLWDSRVAPRGSRRASSAVGSTAPGSTGALSSGVAPVMTLRVPGASSVSSVSLAADGVTLATTASNGARVFDLRAPASDRPARLASKEPGQRWASAFHVGEEIFTVSTAGDVFAWARKDEAMSYAAPFRTARAHRDAAYVAKREECLSGSIRDSAFGDQGAASASASASASFRVPAFACSASALGVSNTRVVLTASGDRGECVRAWDAESGDTLAEWGADGGAGGGAAAYGARGFAGVAHAPVTALCWGSGPEGERFGKTSFAVGTAEGIVRVYGP
jgi:hypothetical protein